MADTYRFDPDDDEEYTSLSELPAVTVRKQRKGRNIERRMLERNHTTS